MMLEVKILVDVPAHASLQQAEDWLKFRLGASPELSLANPLSDYDLYAERVEVFQKF
jgi:hypothetical protein